MSCYFFYDKILSMKFLFTFEKKTRGYNQGGVVLQLNACITLLPKEY